MVLKPAAAVRATLRWQARLALNVTALVRHVVGNKRKQAAHAARLDRAAAAAVSLRNIVTREPLGRDGLAAPGDPRMNALPP
jgi:hypothetical protein